MIYEGKLNIKEYKDDEYIREVLKELSNMKLSFTPLYSFKTLEIFAFIYDNSTESYKFIERYSPIKFNRDKFSPLACAIFIKALTEYKMEQHN